MEVGQGRSWAHSSRSRGSLPSSRKHLLASLPPGPDVLHLHITSSSSSSSSSLSSSEHSYHRRSQDFLCGGALFLSWPKSWWPFLVITFFCMVISVIYATNISLQGAPRQIHPILPHTNKNCLEKFFPVVLWGCPPVPPDYAYDSYTGLLRDKRKWIPKVSRNKETTEYSMNVKSSTRIVTLR